MSKLSRLEQFFRKDMDCQLVEGKPSYLTEQLLELADIPSEGASSQNGYDKYIYELIESLPDGLLLDCGAGLRPEYFSNVVNFEISNTASTDVLGVGEDLPFVEGTFDAVISMTVLEHVKDPFKCAAEIVRVLKPGGKLLCCVPFLQPQHGFPNHYYNMTAQGLRALFEGSLTIDNHIVTPWGKPIVALTWLVREWCNGLSENDKRQFLKLSLSTFLKDYSEFLDASYVKNLSEAKNFELAASTYLTATKPI